MKSYQCQCGNPIFFDNTQCMRCGRLLGFDSASLQLLALDGNNDNYSVEGLRSAEGTSYRYCLNHQLYNNCNWLLPVEAPAKLCLSCGLNEVIPDLDSADNLQLWTRVEKAKRRLLYSLLSQGLSPSYENGGAISFRLLEDRNRNPNVYESFVAIGHHQGSITINIAEADDVIRLSIREQMSETYRTVLGHLRHECGHFYFTQFARDPNSLQQCRQTFSDERADYQSSLEKYYQSGPSENWSLSFISAYAASHPAEDFAETFAHYLHITDALETAVASGLIDKNDETDWLEQWAKLATSLNEVSRSLGLDDVYAFFLAPGVREKLELIRQLILRHAQK